VAGTIQRRSARGDGVTEHPARRHGHGLVKVWHVLRLWHISVCQCGWESPLCTWNADAKRSHKEHRESALADEQLAESA
jgi:hypothetical protein